MYCIAKVALWCKCVRHYYHYSAWTDKGEATLFSLSDQIFTHHNFSILLTLRPNNRYMNNLLPSLSKYSRATNYQWQKWKLLTVNAGLQSAVPVGFYMKKHTTCYIQTIINQKGFQAANCCTDCTVPLKSGYYVEPKLFQFLILEYKLARVHKSINPSVFQCTLFVCCT